MSVKKLANQIKASCFKLIGLFFIVLGWQIELDDFINAPRLLFEVSLSFHKENCKKEKKVNFWRIFQNHFPILVNLSFSHFVFDLLSFVISVIPFNRV